MSRGRFPQTVWVRVGEINGLYGLEGGLQVFSYLEQPADILAFEALWLSQAGTDPERREVRKSLRSGPRLVVFLERIDGRDQARWHLGQELWVPRSALGDEVVWADLIGLRVQTMDGQDLGEVVSFMETGANDVLVVAAPDRERLIPFISEYVPALDVETGVIWVDWDPDF